MLLVIAVVCALGCALLAAERLRRVHAVVQLAEHRVSRGSAATAVCDPGWARCAPDSFEHQLSQAWHEGGQAWRAERVDAVVFEVEHQLASWRRIPRVVARVSSTVGFLLAAMLLRMAMADLGDGEGAQVLDSTPLLIEAMQLVAVSLAGSALCLAFGREADRVACREARVVDDVVDALTRDPD